MDCLNFKTQFSYVLIVLAMFPLINSYECPKECQCVQKTQADAVSVSCLFTRLNYDMSFNVLAPQNTTDLLIMCNNNSRSKSTLQPRMFQELFKLEQLIILNCKFNYMGEDVLAGLNSLKNLSIFNALQLSIHPNALLHVPNLEILKIIDSDWHGLVPNSLCTLNKISSLNFRGNQIGSMSEVLNLCSHKQSFFNELMFLELDFNQIQFLKSGFWKRFKKLHVLSMKGNKIEKIPNDTLINFSKLKYLDVSYNYLTQLPDDFLDGCFQVNILNISNNYISKLPQVIRKLKDLWKLYASNTALTDITLLKQTSLIILDIHNSNLTVIPPRFCGKNSYLKQLILSQNDISEIPPNTFKDCLRLIYLDLSVNNISTLFNDSFKGLKRLKMLLLSNNQISNCGKETFVNLRSMTRLNLSRNFLPEIPAIPQRLELIDLSDNHIQNISNKTFSHYSNFYLEYLLLSQNYIKNIEDNAFQFLYKLLILNLKNNNLTVLKRFTFSEFNHLYGLNIAYNKITDIHLVLYKLQNLKYLFAGHNLISKLQRNTFPKELSVIHLQHNQIKTIEWNTFENMETLMTVDLRWNKMVTLDQFSLRISLKNQATNFFIAGNFFQCDCKLAWLKKNSMMMTYKSSGYPIFQDLNVVLCSNYGKHWLPIGLLHSIKANEFLCEYERSFYSKLPFSCGVFCECCLQENCYCQDTCPEKCHCMYTFNRNSKPVNCNNKNLTDASGIPSNATMIDLSVNDLGYLTNKTFDNQSKAEILYLNNSKITGIGERTFITFKVLKVLSLEYNKIMILDSNSLFGLWNLKELLLSHNEIKIISPGTFNATPNLEFLDLSYNNLRKFDSQTFNIDNLKTIILFKNPWSCNCEDVNSLRDFLITRTSEINSQSILCNESQIPVLEYTIDFCQNKSLNSTIQMLLVKDTTLVYGLSIGLTIIAVVMIACIVLYVYRAEIQILLFVRFGWRILSRNNQLDKKDKKYDAFVSYHNSQDEFVVNEMLPRLEGTSPVYKLCVHFRDFAVGAPIVDNITESIENSKRTILLLNNQFLASEWCRYEFQASHFQALSNKMNSLILVLLEEVNPTLIDGGLKHYMKTKTYLRYDDPRFWDKLRFALPDKEEKKED